MHVGMGGNDARRKGGLCGGCVEMMDVGVEMILLG